ncbi:hypothetical protein OG535_34940 [Kitasatospora sp. NBC_00085]|uniref:hypothetical protein n=1 Tax=unclassified Kitasatospora TaxID=2633591 RepID=UPI0032436327
MLSLPSVAWDPRALKRPAPSDATGPSAPASPHTSFAVPLTVTRATPHAGRRSTAGAPAWATTPPPTAGARTR